MHKTASNKVANSQTKEKLQATTAKSPANSFREGVMVATVIHTLYLETVRSQQHRRLTRITIVVLYDRQVMQATMNKRDQARKVKQFLDRFLLFTNLQQNYRQLNANANYVTR
jgi:hypothetical protein